MSSALRAENISMSSKIMSDLRAGFYILQSSILDREPDLQDKSRVDFSSLVSQPPTAILSSVSLQTCLASTTSKFLPRTVNPRRLMFKPHHLCTPQTHSWTRTLPILRFPIQFYLATYTTTLVLTPRISSRALFPLTPLPACGKCLPGLESWYAVLISPLM